MAIKMMVEDIPIEIKRKRIKNMYIYVKAPYGNVVASVPMSASTTEINKFLLPRVNWIRKHREKFTNRKVIESKQYEENDIVFIEGYPYKLKFTHAPTQFAYIEGDYLVLALRNGHYPESRERVIREFLRFHLKKRIEKRLPYYENATGLHQSEWQIKDMDTRWGSCNASTKKIWINLKLAHMPDEFLDYILLHELAHLKISGHGADFSAFLDRFMFDWRDIKKALDLRYMEFI